jgi:hypothetical protein
VNELNKHTQSTKQGKIIITIITIIIKFNSILIYLCANLTAQRPIKKSQHRYRRRKNTHTNKIQKTRQLI